jgi:hypothetical protein
MNNGDLSNLITVKPINPLYIFKCEDPQFMLSAELDAIQHSKKITTILVTPTNQALVYQNGHLTNTMATADHAVRMLNGDRPERGQKNH